MIRKSMPRTTIRGGTRFPPSQSPLRRPKEGPERSCSLKMLALQSIEYEAIALEGARSQALAFRLLGQNFERGAAQAEHAIAPVSF